MLFIQIVVVNTRAWTSPVVLYGITLEGIVRRLLPSQLLIWHLVNRRADLLLGGRPTQFMQRGLLLRVRCVSAVLLNSLRLARLRLDDHLEEALLTDVVLFVGLDYVVD